MERLEEITAVILNTIANEKTGLSIVELAELTGIHRNVLAKYIKVLEAQGKIEISRVGAKKFIQLSHRVSVSFLKVFTTLPFFIFDRHLTAIDKNKEILELYELEHINSDMSDSQDRLLSIFLSDKVVPLLQDGIRGQRSHIELETGTSKNPHSYFLTIIPVVFDNGRPGSALIIEDKSKEEEKRKKCDLIKNAYQELLENQVQFIVRFNRDYKIITTNTCFSEHTGIDEKLLTGSQFIPPYPEENFSNVINRMSSISKSDPVVTLDLRRINKNGDFSWERWKIKGIFDKKSGKFLEYLAIGIDITELKRTEQEFLHLKNNLETIIHTRTIELREVNNELNKEIFRREGIERELALTKFAIDSAHDLIFLLNSDGDIQYMNVRARENLNNLSGKTLNIRDILINDSRLGSKNLLTLTPNEMIDSGILTIKGSIHSTQGKDIPVEITMSRIIEQGEAVFCCIARDITDRTKIERDLYNYRKHLEQIIDERTSRLQKEIDEKKLLETECSQIKNNLFLFTDNSLESVFIYDCDNEQYFDVNQTAETTFNIDRKNLEMIPELFSKVVCKNGIKLNQLISEKRTEFKLNSMISLRTIIQSEQLMEKEVIITLKSLELDYKKLLRIGVIDISETLSIS